MKFINGYKTYIVATLLVAVGLVHLVTGDTNILEFLNDPYLLVLLNGLGLGALRAALKVAN